MYCKSTSRANVSMRQRASRLPLAMGAYLVGSIPFSQIVAKRYGVDLRCHGTGGVSASRVGEFVGFQPMLLAATLDACKGYFLGLVGRALPRESDRALMMASAVVGHNWSLFLRGAGGRGVLPSLGLLVAQAPAGSRTLIAGLALGKSLGLTGFGCFTAYLALIPQLQPEGTQRRASLGIAIVSPALVKRLVGDNRRGIFVR